LRGKSWRRWTSLHSSGALLAKQEEHKHEDVKARIAKARHAFTTLEPIWTAKMLSQFCFMNHRLGDTQEIHWSFQRPEADSANKMANQDNEPRTVVKKTKYATEP